ncbi:Uncharacterised protein [Burkholderia pseudomallei]|nr:Uncharacterised protein [Burkholderia pseudomallei]CPG82077.1 Uncharacterised protein [Burkholderia pseudomallei]
MFVRFASANAASTSPCRHAMPGGRCSGACGASAAKHAAAAATSSDAASFRIAVFIDQSPVGGGAAWFGSFVAGRIGLTFERAGRALRSFTAQSYEV